MSDNQPPKRRPKYERCVCIGCGRRDTTHPSKICNHCVSGHASREASKRTDRVVARIKGGQLSGW